MKPCELKKQLELTSIEARTGMQTSTTTEEKVRSALILTYCLYTHLLIDGLDLPETQLNDFLDSNTDLVSIKDLLLSTNKSKKV